MNHFNNLSPEDAEYVLNLPYHLAKAAKEETAITDDLSGLLTDYEFIEYKNFSLLPQPLIDDYDLALHPDIQIHQETKESLKLIQSAIRLAANVLADDPAQLAGQLWGRLLFFKKPEIQAMLAQTQELKGYTWLRPLTSNLTPPERVLLRTLQGHTEGVTDVVVTPDSQKAVSASQDCTLKIWDLQQGVELHTLKGHTDGISGVVVTPDGKCCISSSWDGTLRLWDLELGTALRTLESHTKGISAVAITPDGRLAISASQDYTRKVWELRSGQLLASYSIAYRQPSEFPILIDGQLHKLQIKKTPVSEELAITLDGQKVISASNHCGPNNTTLTVWHLTNGDEVFSFSHMSGIHKLVLMPDGKRVISASDDHTIKVWDLENGAEVFTFNSNMSVESLALTPNGQSLLSTSGNKITLWDINSRKEIGTLGNHNQVHAITVTPNGKQAISGSLEGSLKLWNLDNRLEQLPQSPHSNSVKVVLVVPDGQRAISGSQDGTLKIWNLQNCEELLTLNYHRAIQAVALMPDGQRAISGSQDGTLKIWNLQSGTELDSLAGEIMPPIECSTSRGITIDIPSKIATPVQALVVTPDGQQVIGGLGDGNLQIWNLKKKLKQFRLNGHTQQISGLAITSDGRQVISSSFDGTLIVWDVERKTQLCVIHSHNEPINSIALMPDNQHVISASHDGTLKMWHLRSKTEQFMIKAHNDIVWAVAVIPDKQLAVSVSKDYTLKVWNMINRKLIATFSAESPLKCCAVDASPLTIVAGEELGKVHFLRLQGLEEFKGRSHP
ncbi:MULTISPECIES: WD40 repeat domain-containing protein [unclassified Microcoleus]|uniref:WD40 repeat domain-containing protein n=1 Tax=unclassified Microcoleus TaxID=2642155 RepID=UPI002FCF61F6